LVEIGGAGAIRRRFSLRPGVSLWGDSLQFALAPIADKIRRSSAAPDHPDNQADGGATAPKLKAS